MKNHYAILLLLTIPFFCFSCKDDDNLPPYDLIVYGSQANVGMTWKNGIAMPITDAGKTSNILAGVTFGSETHLVGYQISNGIKVAKYWKNDLEISLSDGTKNEEATAITIVGNDVYIAGYESSNGKFGVKYWKNGTPFVIQSDMLFAFVGSDVYVTGVESKPDSVVGKYWKNGISYNIDKNSKYSYAYGAKSFENDVYIVGSSFNNNIEVAKYWKNGEETVLSDGLTNARATAIAVAKDEVYVGGTNIGSPVYWENGLLKTLNSLPNSSAYITQIKIFEGDLFVSARLSNNGLVGSLVWKNGVYQEPFLGTNQEIRVEGLLISLR